MRVFGLPLGRAPALKGETTMDRRVRLVAVVALAACAAGWPTAIPAVGPSRLLDHMLTLALQAAGFTGRIEEQLEARLGRKVDLELAELGRLLFFDPIGALHEDNACAGCHAPSAGMGDTQSMAIGIQSNRVVGPSRTGPRNQRRTPTVVNNAFYPKLMWNGRFFAPSGDPFDGSLGFRFPLPEGATRFPEERSRRHAPSHRAGPHPADRARRSRRLHRDVRPARAALRAIR